MYFKGSQLNVYFVCGSVKVYLLFLRVAKRSITRLSFTAMSFSIDRTARLWSLLWSIVWRSQECSQRSTLKDLSQEQLFTGTVRALGLFPSERETCLGVGGCAQLTYLGLDIQLLFCVHDSFWLQGPPLFSDLCCSTWQVHPSGIHSRSSQTWGCMLGCLLGDLHLH